MNGAPTGFPLSIYRESTKVQTSDELLLASSEPLSLYERNFIYFAWMGGWLVPWEIAGIPVGISQTNELSKRTYNRFTRREPLSFPLIFASIAAFERKNKSSLSSVLRCILSGMILFRSE